MTGLNDLTTEQSNALNTAWKILDAMMQPLHNTHSDTIKARKKAEAAWDDFFALCDAYGTDRIGAYMTCSIYA